MDFPRLDAVIERRSTNRYLRWRILLRMRRFFRPTLRRPLRFFIGLPRAARAPRGWFGGGQAQPRQAQPLVQEPEAVDKALRQLLRRGAVGQPLQQPLDST